MRSAESRLAKLEQAAREIKTATPDTPCICPFGERRFYIVVDGMTEVEVAERIPHNKKHCQKCGGLNQAIPFEECELDL